MNTFDLDKIHSLTPVFNQLPGEPVPYYMASGEGQRHEKDGQLITVVARSDDTGGLFEAAFIIGPQGAHTAAHVLPLAQRSYFVVDGSIQVSIAGASRTLVQGDSFHVPPGAVLEYRMLSHLTRLFMFSAPGGSLSLLLEGSEEVQRHIFAATATAENKLLLPSQADGWPLPAPEQSAEDGTLPRGAQGYFLRAGHGDHRAWPDALNTYLARPANTGGRYFAVNTLAAPQPYIIRHFHQLHTENFICLSGRVWLWVNGEEVLLTAGDFLHAPAGTIHSFAIAAHNTQMLGLLTGGIFEKFFDVTSIPTSDSVYTEGLVNPSTVIGGIKANPDLDLEVVGPPPERTRALGI